MTQAVEIKLYGDPVGTVFDLLGDKENDITYAVGWALSRSPRFCQRLMEEVAGVGAAVPEPDLILLQEGISGAGFTDIEIKAGSMHVVIEAKRGWSFPSEAQLRRYAERTVPPPTAMLVMAEATPEFTRVHRKVPKRVAAVPVSYRSWEQVARLAAHTGRTGAHAERRLLRELVDYLKGLMTMQKLDSNEVYVVSLGGQIEDTDLTFRDPVLKHNVYFCPIGGAGRRGGYPKEPPNYIGFRFDGKLQQIRHVDSYEVREDHYAGFKPLKGKVDWSDEPHWLFHLGTPIVPRREVRTGRIGFGRQVRAALDLLLTCDTIAEARDRTQERLRLAEKGV